MSLLDTEGQLPGFRRWEEAALSVIVGGGGGGRESQGPGKGQAALSEGQVTSHTHYYETSGLSAPGTL